MMRIARLFLLIAVCAMIVNPYVPNAEPFSPALLKLRAEPKVEYVFDGSPFELPFTVEGTPAGVLFLVYTKDKAQDIGIVENGYLGWHYVNKVDTCIYYSTLKSVGPGDHVYEWDGRDQDGGVVPPGEYTYYLWAFDNQSEKQQMGESLDSKWGFDYRTGIQEVDKHGLPLANPIWFNRALTNKTIASKWIIGSDPFDETLLVTSTFEATNGWVFRGEPLLDPSDFDMWYSSVGNADKKQGSILKYKFVSGGDAELQTGWGEADGFATMFATNGGDSPGVATDGNYLFTGDANHTASIDPDADFYIYDFDGHMIKHIDLTPWWSNPNDYEAGGQTNGGPNNFYVRNGKVFLNCHCSCFNQMVDPARFMESGDNDDFYVWSNGNGDYTLDKNFEETAPLKWVCNDYNASPNKSSISADTNLFYASVAYDIGAVSFGLFAPDGTGLGYCAFAGKTPECKRGMIFLDSDTPFDGIYFDNNNGLIVHSEPVRELSEPGIFFLGHDSISGVITSSDVSVESEADNPTPTTFSLSQNRPNPFNPATSIPFTLPKEGRAVMTVFDITGRRVATLADGVFTAGSHEIVWDASGMASGVYICRLEAAGKVKTVKMMLAK